jgi:ABC-type sugar transport system substrate-binding protein
MNKSKGKWILASAASVLLAACAMSATFVGAASAEDKKVVIRYIYKSQAHWWPPEIDKKIEEEAAKLGVDYQVVGPEGGDIAKQVEMIENYVSQKIDVLAVASLGPATCQAIDDAVDAGIKVVMADGDCSDSKRIAYYGSNNKSLGADTAVLFAEAVKGKGHQKVLIITGTPGAENLIEREQGFKDKAKELGLDVEYLPTIPCYEDTQKAIDIIESSLRADPTITAVYPVARWPFQAASTALPVMTSRVKAGKLTVVSIDAFPEGLKMIEDGIIYGMTSQNLGQLTVGPLAFAYEVGVKGVKFPPVCSWANILITKDGGPGRMTAEAFNKKIWQDYDWDTHEVTPADCQS